jgi:hypothetical protein
MNGTERIAFICKHINKTTKTGFIEPRNFMPWDELEEDEDLQAYCFECEKVLEQEGGEWNEKAEAFADVRIVCESCYFEMKEINHDLDFDSLQKELEL